MRKLDRVRVSIAAVGGFFFVRYVAFLPLGNMPGFAAMYRAAQDAFELGFDAAKVLLVFGLLAATHRMTASAVVKELGLARGAGVGLTIGLLAALPMLFVLCLFSSLNPQVTILSVLRTGVGSSVAEEVLYRGYLFGQLYRRGRWSFWLASLANGVPWAIGHLYQTSQTGLGLAAGTVEVLIVMTLSAALAAWIYIQWDYSLWVLIGVHGFANVAWMLLGENNHMAYGWVGNIVRVSTFAAIAGITFVRIYLRARNGEPQPTHAES